MAIIEKVNKGADGLIHSANIKTSTGRTNRPTTKLYPLEVTAAETPVQSNSPKEKPATAAGSSQKPARQAALER